MGGGEKGAGGRNSGSGGGAAIAGGEDSPTQSVRGLRAMVFPSESTGEERGAGELGQA